jgi:hypothetical protein
VNAPRKEQTMESIAEQLRALHRAGRLAAEYSTLRGLLSGAGDEEIALAGRLLAALDPDEVAGHNPGLPAVSVAVTGHGTLGELPPALAGQFARHGLVARVRLSPFDSYVFDLSDPGSAFYAGDPQLALCVLDPAIVLDELPTPWTPEDAEKVLAEKTALIAGLAERFRSAGRGTLVLNTLPLLLEHTAELVDHRSKARLGAAWREANARLLRLGEGNSSVVVIDLEPLANAGTAVREPRMDVYAKAHLSPGLLAGYARQIGHLARNLTGGTDKVLVVDLDGTLWGGTVGDDGPDGIELGGGYRGQAFRSSCPPRASCWPRSARTIPSRSTRRCAATRTGCCGRRTSSGWWRTGARRTRTWPSSPSR